MSHRISRPESKIRQPRSRYATVRDIESDGFKAIVGKLNAIQNEHQLPDHATLNAVRYGWSGVFFRGTQFYASRLWEYPWAILESSVTENMSCLDVGCGESPFLPYLKQEIGCGAVGLDLEIHGGESRNNFGVSRRYIDSTGACIVAGSMAKMPFRDSSFDRVFCLSVIEHVFQKEDRIAGMREIARVLKPGGIALLTMDVNLLSRLANPLELAWESGLNFYGPVDLAMPVQRFGIFCDGNQPADVFGLALAKDNALIHLRYGGDGPVSESFRCAALRDSIAIKKHSRWICDHSYDVLSKYGEDGIIDAILTTIGVERPICFELTRSRGRHYSIILHACRTMEGLAFLCEGNEPVRREMEIRYSNDDSITVMKEFPSTEDLSELDSMLEVNCPAVDFDLLSIRVYGSDYHFWAGLSRHAPKCIAVQFNPTIPDEVPFIQDLPGDARQGCGISSLVDLASHKGYALVAVAHDMAFFVHNRYFRLFQIDDNSLASLRSDRSMVTHVFSGFDGTIFVSGYRRLCCHDVIIDEKTVRQIPLLFRRFPEEFGAATRRLFRLYQRFRHRDLPYRHLILRRLKHFILATVLKKKVDLKDISI